jgi:hypothetical protein
LETQFAGQAGMQRHLKPRWEPLSDASILDFRPTRQFMNLDVFLAFSDIDVRFTQVAARAAQTRIRCCTAADSLRSRSVLNRFSIPFAVRSKALTLP